MSSTYTSPDNEDFLGLNNTYFPTTPLESTLLSPFDYSHTVSNSTSPSHNINDTPGESISESSNYQPSEIPELLDDEFFGVNFDADLQQPSSSLSPTLDNSRHQPPQLVHPQSDPAPLLAGQQSFGTTNSTKYIHPLSPIHTSIPSTPSPKSEVNDCRTRPTVSQHGVTTGLYVSQSQNFVSLAPTHPTVLQLTPDQSGSSHTSAEGIEPITLAQLPRSPQVTVSQWGNLQSREAHINTSKDDMSASFPSFGQDSEVPPTRDEEGYWRPSERTGQAGLDPASRRMVNVEVPTLNEQAEKRDLDKKNAEVTNWVAKSTPVAYAEQPANSYFAQYPASDTESIRQPPDVDSNILPVDDAASIRENKPRDGDVYYNFKNNGFRTELNDADLKLIIRRQWHDAPTVPTMTETNFQPLTAADAMREYKENADRFSVISRVATWGTRRRSEPSLSDIESIADGSFLKKMTISDPKGSDRNRQTNLLDTGFDRLKNLGRKRSDSRLKRPHSSTIKDSENSRKESQGSLVPPPRNNSFGRKPTPSINTAFAAMAGPLAAVGTTHARSGSVSATASSPRSTGNISGFVGNVIRRARSRSDLPRHHSSDHVEGIADLLRRQGGPPVPNTSFHSSAVAPSVEGPDMKQLDILDQDEEEDEDDEEGEGDEMDQKLGPDQYSEPIVPNYEGFKDHVRRLNPTMNSQNSWLVSRIAHQQEIRYKNLLNARVKHSEAVMKRNCSAGHLCASSGGKAILLDVKGKRRDIERNTTSLRLTTEFSDDDSSPGDGALTTESFPQGVPMPPTRSLPAEFECQLCFKSKKFQKPSDWTKHVHEDVQPFTCTYDKCKEPKSFKRKADWVRHENERHRHLEWWVCQVEDCKHPCYRKDNFLQHLVREHKLPEPKQKTKAAIKKAHATEPAWVMVERCHHETTNRAQDEPCKFCGKTFNTWKKLTVHLAKHMEHISLPILRLVEERKVDANTIISPVEQILTPVTPMPKLESSASPFNLNDVSPHTHTQSQFSSFQQSNFYNTPAPAYGMQPQMQQPVMYEQGPIYTNPDSFQMEQSHGFGSMDARFSPSVPEQSYNPHQPPQYSIPQAYASGPPAVSTFQPHNLLSINGPGFGFDPMSVSTAQSFQQVPISQPQGSVSPYGHSLHNGQIYGQ